MLHFNFVCAECNARTLVRSNWHGKKRRWKSELAICRFSYLETCIVIDKTSLVRLDRRSIAACVDFAQQLTNLAGPVLCAFSDLALGETRRLRSLSTASWPEIGLGSPETPAALDIEVGAHLRKRMAEMLNILPNLRFSHLLLVNYPLCILGRSPKLWAYSL